eukprot:365104-Chlamydomonas_euryale.AAC.19
MLAILCDTAGALRTKLPTALRGSNLSGGVHAPPPRRLTLSRFPPLPSSSSAFSCHCRACHQGHSWHASRQHLGASTVDRARRHRRAQFRRSQAIRYLPPGDASANPCHGPCACGSCACGSYACGSCVCGFAPCLRPPRRDHRHVLACHCAIAHARQLQEREASVRRQLQPAPARRTPPRAVSCCSSTCSRCWFRPPYGLSTGTVRPPKCWH